MAKSLQRTQVARRVRKAVAAVERSCTKINLFDTRGQPAACRKAMARLRKHLAVAARKIKKARRA
jgi:hypothetical protein